MTQTPVAEATIIIPTTTTTTSTLTNIQYEDPLSVFLYALKAPETRRQYPRRLKVFLDLKLQGSVEQQSIQCLILVKQNPQWLQFSLMQFKSFQKERARNGEISYSTINNYYKATKLFIEMNMIHLLSMEKDIKGYSDRQKSC